MPKSALTDLKFLAVAGVGLFADGYLNITIGLVIPMIGYLYYEDNYSKVPTVPSDVIKGGMAIGMILGQLTFGIFGDALGRHKIYGKELLFTIFGTLMLIVIPPRISHEGLVAWMTIFRIITGMGTGGDYPMTSSISAEHNCTGSRAKLVLTVFSFIGLGGFSGGLVFLILLSAFGQAIDGDISKLQWVWRLLFGIGLIPCILTLYSRLTMKESKPYEAYVSKSTGLFDKDKRGLKQQLTEFLTYFSNWKHARTLFAVSFCWFLFDIAFYGINLNQSIILTRIGFSTAPTPYQTLHNTAIGNLIVSCAGYLPGYYIAIFLPDLLGRKTHQCLFSALTAILYAVWAGVSRHASTAGLIALFTMSQLSLNAGPNATTFLIPTEVFPTRVRGSAHGIAAASGKAGAVLTAFAFGTVTERIGLEGVLGLFSGLMALCAVTTLLIPETKGKTIDEIENSFGDETPEAHIPSDASAESRHTVEVVVEAK